MVRGCAVQYLRPARLDDLLAVEVGLAEPAADLGRASLRLAQRALLDDGTVLATASVRVACVDRESGRPVALPEQVTTLMKRQVLSRISTRSLPDGTAEQQ